ncbi:GNAT family N-acetyltransferase [Streptomyces liangshanensis]|uniref:GNAT family N-acetyltransferase n=1 Tax=Streptomyces liangshanensis TaxID=2717324 RepID=A0A6G9H2K0_9ACTN|nr:GNAT family N-acetyltransferase [Streptomyces liangshanensis]QIQ04357.1 GNAT family N-acetyltransferase [Streptomyces liangshanensis]
MLELRAVDSDDWAVWRELRLAALAEAPYAFGSTLAQWQGDGDREERWRARLGIPGAHDVIAVVDGRPAGMASGVPVTGAEGAEDCVELISMWVSPAARGRGVGDSLIGEVVRWAVARGARSLRLSVMPDNGRAVALYERNGFTDAGAPVAAQRDGAGASASAGTGAERAMVMDLR